MEIKSRNTKAHISGTAAATGISTISYSRDEIVSAQRTLSQDTPFPAMQRALRSGKLRGTGAEWVFTHRDWGAGFITQRTTVESNLNGVTYAALKGSILPFYRVVHNGPCLLADHSGYSFYTDSELNNAEQLLWMKGGEAVRIARPNKPQVDTSVLIGEIRKEGIPQLIGSIAGRSRTIMELFRNGSKEYLNLQFGWVPLLRDLTKLVQLVPESRRILEQYERDIDRLVRRRFHFPDQIDTNTTLSYSADHASYRRMVEAPWGFAPEDHVTFRPTGQVPSQINQTITKTWFSGGFRFYHRSVPEALEDLSRFEEQANLLLGTRIDPEVLWNLAPWTWLSDWFINFGDVVGNASAFMNDDLVMQYGYLMRTTYESRTVSWPEGLFVRQPTGQLTSVWSRLAGTAGYAQTVTRVTKQRGKASPFGFGLNDSDLTDHQLAILAALGMSRK